jgi:hypothetical protein
MTATANVCLDELLDTLFKKNNINERDEIRFQVCELLKTLGLVKLDVTTDPDSQIIDLYYFHTPELENILDAIV